MGVKGIVGSPSPAADGDGRNRAGFRSRVVSGNAGSSASSPSTGTGATGGAMSSGGGGMSISGAPITAMGSSPGPMAWSSNVGESMKTPAWTPVANVSPIQNQALKPRLKRSLAVSWARGKGEADGIAGSLGTAAGVPGGPSALSRCRRSAAKTFPGGRARFRTRAAGADSPEGRPVPG